VPRKTAENTVKHWCWFDGSNHCGGGEGSVVVTTLLPTAHLLEHKYANFSPRFFTKEMSGEVLEADWVYKENGNGLCDTDITERIVSYNLDRLRDDKAAGSDDLLPRFLNVIRQELVCPLVILFKKVER